MVQHLAEAAKKDPTGQFRQKEAELKRNKGVIEGSSVAIVAMMFALLPTSVSHAQEAEEMASIVVTARARAEKVQDIPDSVTVIGADVIRSAGIESIDDATIYTPNLSLVDAQDAGTVTLTIRGIGQVRNGEAPVAIVVDGVQLNSPDMIKQALFDVEQIEILKGPQGALYGRNAIGGAINITTKQPGNELEGRFGVEYSNGDDRQISGAVGGAIIPDKLRFRIAADYRKFDGVLHNVTLDRKVDFAEDLNLRGRLILLPSDRLTIDVRGTHARLDGGASWYIPVPDHDANNTSQPIVADVLGHSGRDFDEVSLKVDYEFEPFTLTSTTAWSKTDLDLDEDLDWTPAAVFGVYQERKLSTTTQEVRLTSPSSQALRWTAGGYFLDGTRKVDSIFLISPDFTASQLPLTDYFPLPIARTSEDMRAWAAYGQINYDALPGLELTAALRYDHDRRIQADRLGVNPRQRETFSAWQPKFSVNYKMSPDSSVYLTLAKGFRSGGFNAPTGAFPLVVKPEVTKGIELGSKNLFMGRRLTANLAGFYTRFENQQIFILKVSNQGLVNVAKSDIWGLELETSYRASRAFSAGASLGVIDAKIKDYDGSALYRDNHLPLTYGWSYTLWAQANLFVGETKLSARADYSGKGGNYWHVDNLDKQDQVHVVNARLSATMGRFEAAIYARNLFNEKYTEEFFSKAFSGAGSDIRYPSSPRRYGVSMTYSF